MARKIGACLVFGSEAIMKLVVNTLRGIGMQAIAEAVALGEKSGLGRNRFRNCGGRSSTCRQTGKSDKERLQPANSTLANEQGFWADSRARSCGRRRDARDTSGFSRSMRRNQPKDRSNIFRQ